MTRTLAAIALLLLLAGCGAGVDECPGIRDGQCLDATTNTPRVSAGGQE